MQEVVNEASTFGRSSVVIVGRRSKPLAVTIGPVPVEARRDVPLRLQTETAVVERVNPPDCDGHAAVIPTDELREALPITTER